MKWLKHPVLLLSARLLLGGVFILASWDKLLHPDLFADVVANYQILPNALVNLTAMVLPWVEFACGLLLFVGWQLRPAGLVLLVLSVVFTVGMTSAIARGLDIDCGCFHVTGGNPVGWLEVLRDLLFVGLAVLVLRASHHRWAVDTLFSPRNPSQQS